MHGSGCIPHVFASIRATARIYTEGVTDPLIASLTRAVEAAPDDVRLRTHLAEILIQTGRSAEAVTHCAIALQYAPTDAAARALMTRALSPQDAQASVGPADEQAPNATPEQTPITPAEQTPDTPAEEQTPDTPAEEPTPDTPAEEPTPDAVAEQTPSTAAEQEPSTPAEGQAPNAVTEQEPDTPAAEQAPSTPADEQTPDAPPEQTPSTPAEEQAPSAVTEQTPNAAEEQAPDATPEQTLSTSAPAGALHSSPPFSEDTAPSAPGSPEARAPSSPTTSDGSGDFDWQRAEENLGGGPAAPFVSSGSSESSESGPALSEPHLVKSGAYSDPTDWEVERAGVCLADVGGMIEVKNRLEASFLAPMRNPELRRLYAKSLRGGLLLYGPPGTGKTFIARAVAGEMGAGFLSVMITDILDPYIGKSEANIHNVFQQARKHAPCVLFLDELDAIGLKRSASNSTIMRSTVNQLLSELDGIGSDNEGVYLLAATNAPWDIDPALRRPGRLDRTLLVLPPDEPARATILHTHLRERPVEGIDLQILARMTEGLTGADLSHVCDSAAEKALLDSVRTGRPRLMNMQDMYAALREVRPSTGPWFETARTVVEYSDTSGEYAELREWMKRHHML